jgi:uncharacterized protein YdhG (YjbR/CyaY superfamily)
MPDTKKKPARPRSGGETSGKFSEFELEAMKERANELKSAKRRGSADAEADVLAKFAEMPESDRVLAEGIHEIIKATVPELTPRTWYGMPAYAKDGKVLCFFTSADKFKARYATFGFSEEAMLDDGTMWPTGWGITKLTPENKKLIAALVKKAAG